MNYMNHIKISREKTNSVNIFEIDTLQQMNYSNASLPSPELHSLFHREYILWKIAQINEQRTQIRPNTMITHLDAKYRKLGSDQR